MALLEKRGGGLGVSSYLETFLDLFEPLKFSLRLGKWVMIFNKACLRSHFSIFAHLRESLFMY